MKKIFLAVFVVALLPSLSFGAASDDVYLRQDVFDAKMEALFLRLHGEIETLGNKLNGRIDTLSARIDGLEKRVETTNTFLYYLLVLFGAMLLLPIFSRWWERHEERKQAVTLEDVKRLIAEAKLTAAS
ncbi:MAG: hypothetical protein IJP53_08560 [Synergistaceae bacterium]|nr:hypothetical protein [Synergistaceae bacterium]